MLIKKAAVNVLNNSNLSNKSVLRVEFRRNISPVDVIKKGSFGGTYFRDIYSYFTDKFYKNSWKEFKELKDVDGKYFRSDFHHVKLNYYGVEVGTSLRFWEKKGWIDKIDSNRWFQWYFRYWKGRRSSDDIRQINRWKRIVIRFVGILKKLISKNKDSPKIRQVLLHWCYELK